MKAAATNFRTPTSRSEQTKLGIAQARSKGIVWGSHGKIVAARNRDEARAFAENLRPVIRDIILAGARRPTALTHALNSQGVPTRQNKRWHPSSVHRLLQLLGPSLREEVKALGAAKTAELKKLMGVR